MARVLLYNSKPHSSAQLTHSKADGHALWSGATPAGRPNSAMALVGSNGGKDLTAVVPSCEGSK